MKKRAVLGILGVAAVSVGCSLSLDDFALSFGHEGAWPATYITFKKTPSAQLLLALKVLCNNDGACVLSEMKKRKPSFGIAGWGQAEYDEALAPQYGDQIRDAINAVRSVNEPAACVRVALWKSVGWGVYTNVRWYATNDNCEGGGDLNR
jgi:hypothetical protein